jgi:DNA repair photolyase
LDKQIVKFRFLDSQVLLCFTGDAYCQKDVELVATRKVLEILYNNKIPVSILSKGGSRVLRDLDIIKKFGDKIKVGATMVFSKDEDRKKMESGASSVEDRYKSLEIFYQNKVKTWVSLEPVIDVRQTLEIIDRTYCFVDEYKVGKINNYGNYNIDWEKFLYDAVEKLNKYGKNFYIKKDLAVYNKRLDLSKNTKLDMFKIDGWKKKSLF